MQLQGTAPSTVLQAPTGAPSAAPSQLQGSSSGQTLGLNTGSPAPAPAPSNPVNTTPGTYGYGFNLPEYLAGIQQEYGGAVQRGSQQIAQNQQYLPVQQADINRVAQGNINQASTQTAGQNAVANSYISGAQNQQALSLAELADQIRSANQGWQAQLGAQGAGFSSAAPMGQFGLAKEQNLNRANVQQQTANTINPLRTEIEANNQNLTQYQNNINAWKQQQIDSVMKNYATIQSQLEQAITQAQGEEKARLGMFGVALQNAAGSALTQIDTAVSNALANNRVDYSAGSAQFQPNAQAGAPAAITSPAVSPFQPSGTTDQGTDNMAGGSLVSILQRQANGG